jgi:Flp pilus assembly protein TadG
MWKVLARARRRFAREERGNIGIVFAAAAVPMIGLLGGAVDVTRHARYKTELLNAMDAAAIALVKHGAKNNAEADKFVNGYINALLPQIAADRMLAMAAFDAVDIEGGYRVVSDGDMRTAFMPVIGIQSLPLDLVTEVQMSAGKYEVALVLDNTGSMANYGRIEALQDAANDLVDDLYKEPGTEDRVKMALVPFVTTVNIKTPGVFQDSWVDPTGPAATFGFNFDEPVNRLDLFDDMNVAWKGCVEARQPPYDEQDVAPVSAETRSVPYLWPDEPDGGEYNNDYLDDETSGDDWQRLRNADKYADGHRGRSVPNTSSFGPNAACAEPIVELTNDTTRMHDAIGKMKPHNRSGGNSSGTNVAQGLVWGWSVLSPQEPYSQGVAYDDETTTKVLVLLSDGRNQIVPNNEGWRDTYHQVTESDYTGYGYLAAGRLGSDDDYLVAERAVDAKVSRICESIKDKGIRLYTILFQVDFESTQDIFRDCASENDEGEPLYYYVPDASTLETAFEAIGEDLTTLRVTR